MAARRAPVLGCRFYCTPAGSEPVREWLKGLRKEVRHAIGTDAALVQKSWPVGKPLVDESGAGLYEVRTNLDGNIYRVLFCLDGSVMVLLHGFQKRPRRRPSPTWIWRGDGCERRRSHEKGTDRIDAGVSLR